ncbi:MAG: sodium:proton antiporter [Candidatus Schekmanbacteria bacterium RBG_13_48_7]|uniref:Sodium:proton antiporter n=1 Tax=Candidatus Schekmanbacteria bacterium RBG_13_48_7 TaxID=1817878 RepID=A0A1F7S240_9BACT|nr:MAG: sodium:proton antiporter [Candidatus Schekmanbacteria bacterium RBG_13_48_7]
MEHESTLQSIPLIASIPFIVMLGCIAVLPLVKEHFWEKNRNKLIIALILGIPTAIYLLSTGFSHNLIHTMVFDYIPFIILLGGLFCITGGITLTGDIEAKPLINSIFMAIGAVLASFMGTTGAAMLLIRPILQTNKERQFKVHTVLFFIGIVANCGGMLTPLGDPPLFMMYLRGTPFTWFFHLWKPWLFVNALTIIVYFIVDTYFHSKEPEKTLLKDKAEIQPIRMSGGLNFLWLLGVILSIAFINEQYIHAMHQNHYLKFLREGTILLMAAIAYVTSKPENRKQNNFTWHPIIEVAYLFLGIFITMVPCLIYLEVNAHHLGVNSPRQFYYYTGLLSSFLDNTPTAVTFYSLAIGLGQKATVMVAGIPFITMISICLGAVFFGSMTYIGNGPNFMVKSVAEENQVKMPSFFGYILKFSIPVLLPILVLTAFLFVK